MEWRASARIAPRYRAEERGEAGDRPLIGSPGITETFGVARPSLGGLDLPIARRSVGDERIEQLVRRTRHVLDRKIKRCLIRFRGPAKAAQLADELQRRSMDLLVRWGRLAIVQGPDVAAHGIYSISILHSTTATILHQCSRMSNSLTGAVIKSLSCESLTALSGHVTETRKIGRA